ncbi:MAG: alcohol dehydrogenase, partial [Staphylococcus equorum]|nr:alcohol dehydrogenase [Staphylococcus equorum]
YMYSRPLHETEDMTLHREYLTDISEKIEAGVYQPTLNKVIDGLTANSLFDAHKQLENQNMIGKLVIQLNQGS